MALNLEADNVGIVIFGDDRSIREGTLYVVPHLLHTLTKKGLLGRVVDALGNPIDGKGPLKNVERAGLKVKAPASCQSIGA